MSIYLILDNTIHDAAKYEEYKRAVPALVAKHGGEYLARDARFEVLAGDWKPNRIVIFKWPSRAAIDAFMSDPEDQPWKKLRASVATANNLLLVEGL
jgi:uncharacterized protein (DUF1330 family)